jgi:hypothetical protein
MFFYLVTELPSELITFCRRRRGGGGGGDDNDDNDDDR